MKTWIEGWPVYRQLTGQDKFGLGAAAKSGQTSRRQARTETAEKVVKSVCPYCAVGCGQKVYVQGGQVTQIAPARAHPRDRPRIFARLRPAQPSQRWDVHRSRPRLA